jgi:hypothetical protein
MRPSYLKVLENHGSKCEVCSKDTGRLDIHHKDNNGYGKTSRPNNNINNLMIVCRKCHLGILHHPSWKYNPTRTEKQKAKLAHRNAYILLLHGKGWSSRKISRQIHISHVQILHIINQAKGEGDERTGETTWKGA